jgi:hypothetical protein
MSKYIEYYSNSSRGACARPRSLRSLAHVDASPVECEADGLPGRFSPRDLGEESFLCHRFLAWIFWSLIRC